MLYISLSGLIQAYLPWGCPYILFVISDKGGRKYECTLCVSLKVRICVLKYDAFYSLISYIAHILLCQLCQAKVPDQFNVQTNKTEI